MSSLIWCSNWSRLDRTWRAWPRIGPMALITARNGRQKSWRPSIAQSKVRGASSIWASTSAVAEASFVREDTNVWYAMRDWDAFIPRIRSSHMRSWQKPPWGLAWTSSHAGDELRRLTKNPPAGTGRVYGTGSQVYARTTFAAWKPLGPLSKSNSTV